METDDAKSATPVVCIPYEGETDEDEDYMQLLGQEDETLEEVQLRLEAYRKAWIKCLQWLQSSIRSQHEPMVRDVVEHIQNAYAEKVVNTPYQELPVVCIQSSLSGSSILDDISVSLNEANDLSLPTVLQVHLYASETPNVMGGMKSIITNITERLDVLDAVKRKASTSVANFDIEMLVAWYTALCNTTKNALDPLIAVIMHDFEQFNPSVVQDIFYIFSQHVSRLRSVFVVSISSPVSPSFLHVAYPHSTLALLCLETFIAPSGHAVLEKALQYAFFNVGYDPDILLGPKTLEQIIYNLKRNSISHDAFLSSLQLVHLRHFLLNPLSLLAQETPSIVSSGGFLRDILSRRLQIADQVNGRRSPSKKRSPMETGINEARANFAIHSQNMRLAFGLVQLVYDFTTGLQLEVRKTPQFDLADLMLEALRGRIYKHVQRLTQIVRNLDECQLTSMLDQLHEYFERPPLLKNQKKAREEIANFLSLIADNAKRPEKVADDLCDWLEDYIEGLTKRFDDLPLWEVWYTGDAPFPSEFLNPSVRSSILSGLLRPHDYAVDPDTQALNDRIPEIWEFPDTSILFTRYLESGKMINVYDWFESFQVALEGQRENLKLELANGNRSPRKRREKGKTPSKSADSGEMAEEKWKLEVQTRFMRALHELDYLGFIKHTGRKADHVLRTVFEVGD